MKPKRSSREQVAEAVSAAGGIVVGLRNLEKRCAKIDAQFQQRWAERDSYFKNWPEGEVRTTREVAQALKLTTPDAFKLCTDRAERGELSKYGYRVKGGWEDPQHTNRKGDSLGWQRN